MGSEGPGRMVRRDIRTAAPRVCASRERCGMDSGCRNRLFSGALPAISLISCDALLSREQFHAGLGEFQVLERRGMVPIDCLNAGLRFPATVHP
jgi:hypothetical protein